MSALVETGALVAAVAGSGALADSGSLVAALVVGRTALVDVSIILAQFFLQRTTKIKEGIESKREKRVVDWIRWVSIASMKHRMGVRLLTFLIPSREGLRALRRRFLFCYIVVSVFLARVSS
jgi:hypothetical protein